MYYSDVSSQFLNGETNDTIYYLVDRSFVLNGDSSHSEIHLINALN